MNETPSARQPESAGGEMRAAETAEAHTLAQRAAAPEAGQQDWLAAEEVAVLQDPEQETQTARDIPARTGPDRLPKRAQIHIPKTTGERAADAVAVAMGSWRFIIIQSAIVAAWIALNLVAVLRHFDPYPFILLNLLFSTQAAYAAPIIMMSQNRQATKDRQRDDHEAVTVDATADIVMLTHENTKEIQRLAHEQAAILAAQDKVLSQQTEMLTLLREHMAQPEEARKTEVTGLPG